MTESSINELSEKIKEIYNENCGVNEYLLRESKLDFFTLDVFKEKTRWYIFKTSEGLAYTYSTGLGINAFGLKRVSNSELELIFEEYSRLSENLAKMEQVVEEQRLKKLFI